jgi:hypothetical protein
MMFQLRRQHPHQLEGKVSPVIRVDRLKPAERPTTAEFVLIVEEAWQRIGLVAILVAHNLQAGEQRGIDDFRADVLTTNDAMLHLLARHTDVTADLLP